MGRMKDYALKQTERIELEPLKFFPRRAELKVTEYAHDGSPALIGVDRDTGEHMWTATVCFPDAPLEEGCVWIRSTGIYEGMLEALARIYVIEFTGEFVRLPHGVPNKVVGEYVYKCKLLM